MSHLEMTGISKAFSGNQVLDNVDLVVEGGQVLALLGENGAGKSTLMKILTGVYQADQGRIAIDGTPVQIDRIQDAQQLGIGMIHQELNLFPNLTIAENFLIGNEEQFKVFGLVNYRLLHDKVAQVLKTVNLHRDPSVRVSELGVGEQQLVEIGKALQRDVRFLVMDEPTSALTEAEVTRLFEIIKSLTARGVGVVYISHRMEELYQIADVVTVLRDGSRIATRKLAEVEEHELVSMMVGRTVDNRYPKVPSQPGRVLLQATDVATSRVRAITLEVHAGEIVGLGGLMGSGRTEVARALAGVDRIVSGRLCYSGVQVSLRSPADAIHQGIAFVTEDRKSEGLVLPFSVRENMALPTLAQRRNVVGLVQRGAERTFANGLIQQLRVKTSSSELPVQRLSGGNQQKVVIGKWLAKAPSVFILDEPTRGVDVGAKHEIYQLMNQMKAEGKGILIISSDLPELLGMCDRIYVMYDHTVQGELKEADIDQERFMRLATGGEIA